MSEELIILITALAEVEALWLPHRVMSQRDIKTAAAIAERRRLFQSRGIALSIGGGNQSRHAGFIAVRNLISKGLLNEVGTTRNRGVMFTDLGNKFARSISPARRIDEKWWVLELVSVVTSLFEGRTNCGFVHELAILGIDGSRPLNGHAHLIFDFEDHALPLLSAGYLESASDTIGWLGYRVTELGQSALATGKPKPFDRPVTYNPRLGQMFIDLYYEALEQRENWRPSTPNQVSIPLSAGCWPDPLPERPARKRRHKNG